VVELTVALVVVKVVVTLVSATIVVDAGTIVISPGIVRGIGHATHDTGQLRLISSPYSVCLQNSASEAQAAGWPLRVNPVFAAAASEQTPEPVLVVVRATVSVRDGVVVASSLKDRAVVVETSGVVLLMSAKSKTASSPPVTAPLVRSQLNLRSTDPVSKSQHFFQP
jgi:hypothetical protein